jgi:5-methylcytosine-specific restriction endonuclease McrA
MLVGIPMVVDHIVPLAAGGSSTSENLCLACYRCNEFKGPRTKVFAWGLAAEDAR